MLTLQTTMTPRRNEHLPHEPNTSTTPDAENRTSVRQILDGQE